MRVGTLGELKRSGYVARSVKEEMRRNLMSRLNRREPTFPGIHGYDRTVIPAIHNAILARHDMILLGLRGQAKTRILRSLTALLDEWAPIVEGCPINDSPFDPQCKRCRRLFGLHGDEIRLDWIDRQQRYREKLATPDVTVADLIGDIDPIKAANQRLTYADEEVIHFGIIPRTNRGIFAINELPDLAPRIQVALLNLLEERDLQIRGFPLRIPLDVVLVFSANPEDYTSRGNIITPLKDRIDSQIMTHYPATLETAMKITSQEAWTDRDELSSRIEIPDYVHQLVERIAFVARNSELVDQSSGVSARMTISAIEVLQSNLERRALLTGDELVWPRLADLLMLLPAITGKVEMVYEGEQQGAEVVAKQLIGEAMMQLFSQHFPPMERSGRAAVERERRYGEIDIEELTSGRGRRPGADETAPAGGDPYAPVVEWFSVGNRVTLSDDQPFEEYYADLHQIPELESLARQHFHPRHRGDTAFAMELLLEALHQNLRLAREDLDSTVTFAEVMKFNILRTVK